MLETSQHVALARELDVAERTRVQLEHVSRRHREMTMADSYAIQREWVRLQREGGRKVIGHKIGLTSRAMQIASQISEPDYGTLLDSMLLRDGSEVEAPRKVLDTIADNAANAGIVLGGRPMRPDAVDWRWAGALLYKNGVIEESGLGAAVLNHPANGVAWLANKLAPHGESLAAGEIVLGGSFTRPVACAAGDTFHADYGPLGSISLRFV